MTSAATERCSRCNFRGCRECSEHEINRLFADGRMLVRNTLNYTVPVTIRQAGTRFCLGTDGVAELTRVDAETLVGALASWLSQLPACTHEGKKHSGGSAIDENWWCSECGEKVW